MVKVGPLRFPEMKIWNAPNSVESAQNWPTYILYALIILGKPIERQDFLIMRQKFFAFYSSELLASDSLEKLYK